MPVPIRISTRGCGLHFTFERGFCIQWTFLPTLTFRIFEIKNLWIKKNYGVAFCHARNNILGDSSMAFIHRCHYVGFDSQQNK